MAVTVTWIAQLSDPANQTNYSLSTSLSTAASDRIIVVAIHERSNGTPAVDMASVTIAGVTATRAGSFQNNGSALGEVIYYAAVPTGTTGIIAINHGKAQFLCCCDVWAVYGALSTPSDTDGTSGSGASISISGLTIPTDGAGIVGWVGASGAVTWTNATERSDALIDSLVQASGADTTTAGTLTITADGATGNQAIAGIAFSPSPVNRIIAADASSYSLSGLDAAPKRGAVVTAGAGSYALTGADVSLNLSSGVSNYILAAGADTYALTGADAGTWRGRAVVAEDTTYDLTGADANPRYDSRRTIADAASYQLSGAQVTLRYTSLSAEPGGQWVGDQSLPYIDVSGSAELADVSGSAASLTADGDANDQAVDGLGVKYRVNPPH